MGLFVPCSGQEVAGSNPFAPTTSFRIRDLLHTKNPESAWLETMHEATARFVRTPSIPPRRWVRVFRKRHPEALWTNRKRVGMMRLVNTTSKDVIGFSS